MRKFSDKSITSPLAEEIRRLNANGAKVYRALLRQKNGSPPLTYGILIPGRVYLITEFKGVGGMISELRVVSGGENYEVGDLVELSDGNATATVSEVGANGEIVAVTITDPGYDYSDDQELSIVGTDSAAGQFGSLAVVAVEFIPDSFTNVGCNAEGEPFMATADVPSRWAGQTEVTDLTSFDISAVVLENTLGTVIDFQRQDTPGTYLLSVVIPSFDPERTFISASSHVPGTAVHLHVDNEYELTLVATAGNQPLYNILDCSLEICVYP